MRNALHQRVVTLALSRNLLKVAILSIALPQPAPVYIYQLYIIMPDISYEALAGAALVIVLAVGYQYLPKAEDAPSGKSKKKNKKKAKSGDDSGSATETVKQGAEVMKAKAAEVTKKAKGAPKAVEKKAETKPQSDKPTPVPAPITPDTSAPSFAEVAAESADEAPKPKTLAQKIAPKNRKSKVDE